MRAKEHSANIDFKRQLNWGTPMRLLRFRVTNYRSVVDSGWIDADDVTALVGVNESGKTNLLLPLWKLNPAREGEIKPTSDYPKAQYAAVRENPEAYTFIEAEFSTEKSAEFISRKGGLTAVEAGIVRVGRDFEGNYSISFPLFAPKTSIPAEGVEVALSEAKAELNAISALAKEGQLKGQLIAAVGDAEAAMAGAPSIDKDGLSGLADILSKWIPATPAATSALVPRMQRLVNFIQMSASELNRSPPDEDAEIFKHITDNLPRFVYYSNYGNLDSEIYLPHVVDNLKRSDLGAKEAAKARTLRVLFDFVRLSPEEILELGRDFRSPDGRKPSESQIADIADKKRERTILLNSASTDLTKKFRDWWRQGNYTFDFQADGDHFRIWVSDGQRPEKIEMEDRSSGLQWFLSFYLIFLVESVRDHKNSILLLDEPGLSLHPLAQKDLSAFFENLSITNQIIYTTHSPFLVDADMLDRARKVYVSSDGSTKASSDLRQGHEDPRRAGATYAVYSALNMNVAESLLLGCRPVIVEGPSDQHYLSTIKTLVIGTGLLRPTREIVFPPAHGARNARVIASILTGRDDTLPIVFLDSDEAGRKAAQDMRNGLYQANRDRVLSTGDYVNFSDSEIEDLIPLAFLAEAVDRWERRPSTPFADIAVEGQPVVPQLEAWVANEGFAFGEGWKVDLARNTKKLALQGGPAKFPESQIKLWVKLFSDFERSA